MCEKPFTLDPGDAWDLDAIASEQGRELVISFGWNYRPMVQRAKAMMDEYGIGELEQLSVFMASATRDLLSNRGAYPDAAPEAVPDQATWTDRRLSGGGYGQAQLSHALGMALWLTGARAASGFALETSPLDAPVELHNAITYTYEGGAIGVVSGGSAHTGAWGNKHSLEVRGIGSGGQFLIDVEREAFWLHADGEDRQLDVTPGEGLYDCVGPIDAVLSAARGEQFVNQSPAELGARTVEALDIAYRSAGSGAVAYRT
jgi:predicted dehydrogenase